MMNKMKEAIRLILLTSMSNRKIGLTIGMSHNTVCRYRDIILAHDLDWKSIDKMTDNEIESLLRSKRYRLESKIQPDWQYIHKEMQGKHVTLQLLWEDYRLANPDNAYSYSQFTYYYREYVGKIDRSMRQTHRAGECVFVDFAGRTIPYTDPITGKQEDAQIFVGVLGCSDYTFSCAVASQKIPDWIEAHNRMYQFYGGVPQVVVPDNLKSAVIRPGFPPVLNRTYLEQAKHYSIVIIPARIYRPKDKAKGENGVLIVARWILAKLRHRQFFSIEEINAAISELLWQLNERPFKRLPGCRRSRFEELDKSMLSPLPCEIFEYAEWTSAQKIGPDYHIFVKGHYYSVPHSLVGEKIEARVTAKVVELFNKGQRVASHLYSNEVGGRTTLPAHQPASHRHYAELTPDKLLAWGKKIGPASLAAVKNQFTRGPHTLLGIKACSHLQRLHKEYGSEQFEAACVRADQIGSLSVKSIRSILQRGLTRLDSNQPIQINLPLHGNVRGPEYYARQGE